MISKDKQYKTQDGREVRIYATDGTGPYPVHGAIRESNGWYSCSWSQYGKYSEEPDSPSHLIEIKPRIKIERWITVADDGSIFVFTNKVKGGPSVFAVKHIVFEVEEGEGLDAV
jgi:hypothetical protein